VEIIVLWDTFCCSMSDRSVYQLFIGICCFSLWWRRKQFSETWAQSAILHSVTSRKTVLFIRVYRITSLSVPGE